MKSFYLSLVLNLSIITVSTGQQDNYKINGTSIGITPIALLNVWNGYQIEAGYGFLDHYEISLNIGLLRGSRTDKVYSGYRIRPTAKYYFLNDFEDHRFYVGLGYLYRHVDKKEYSNFRMFQGAFIEEKLVTTQKIVKGGFATYGVKQKLEKTNIYFDIGVGLGLGVIDVENQYEPGGVMEFNTSFIEIFEDDGRSGFPILFLHFSIGYNFH